MKYIQTELKDIQKRERERDAINKCETHRFEEVDKVLSMRD